MIKNAVLVALMASATFFVVKPLSAETLKQSVDQALSAHPSVEVALAGKIAAKEDRLEARSGLFPALSASTSAGRIYGDNSTSRGLSVSRGTAYSGLWEGSASLTQPLFDGMETFNRIDAAQARSQSADYNVADVQENLALRAVQAHISVLQAQTTLHKTKSYYSVIEDYLDRIKMMVDEGVADETELAQARNISLMLKSAITDYEGQLEAAYAGYKEIVGTLPRGDLIKPPHASSVIADNVEDALSLAKKNHSLVRSGEKDLEAAGHDVKAEKGAFYPNLDGEISYLKRDQKEEIGGEVEDARALLKMSWDFETGGAQMARTRKSRAKYSEILAQNREVFRLIEGDVRRAYAEYDTAEKQMDLVRGREAVTKELFEAYEVQFEGARVRLLQLMQAENQLFNAQLESITAEYRYLMAQYSVLAAMGQLQDSLVRIPANAIAMAAATRESVGAKNVSKSALSKHIASEDVDSDIPAPVKDVATSLHEMSLHKERERITF